MMENQEKRNGLSSFVEEMKEIQRQETSREISSAHLVPDAESRFVPEELTEADMEMWNKIKNEDVTIEEFQEYKDKVVAEEMAEERDWKNSSRLTFAAFAANRANAVVNKDILRQYREKQ